MPSIVNNLPSMTAQRNLGATQGAFHKAVTRLSSGLRINSAADDAAGLFLSKKLESQVRGLQQASRNAQDGMSLIQTAEGALNVTHSMLLRMRELAVQSANGVLTSADRAAIAEEVKTLSDEITRVANTTSFNGMKLLDGSNGGVQASGYGSTVGSNAAIVNATGATVATAAATGEARSGAELTAANGIDSIIARKVTPHATAGTYTANVPIAYSVSIVSTANADEVNVILHQDADGSTAGGVGTTEGTNQQTITVSNVSGIEGSKLLKFDLFGIDVFVNSNLSVAAAANAGAGLDGDTAGAGSNTGFAVSRNLKLMDTNSTYVGADATVGTEDDIINSSALSAGLDGVVIQVGANNVSEDKLTLLNMNAMTAQGLGLVGKTTVDADGDQGDATAEVANSTYSVSENVKTQTGAQNAIDIIDNAIELVSEQRAKIGAFQNRMEYTITNLGVAAENQAAANSRIVDADVAAEVSNMVKTQILSQSAMAVLAQANAAPQALLSLLS